jgi:glycosyltransferase involved in cell wall biosynthesis
MTDDITVSYVVTVYNKEPYIGHTATSLLKQEGNIRAEYIFVDDVSSDRSLEVIEEVTRGVPDVTIVKNSGNAGPSIRLNQGARLARGKYLQFIDSDDILAGNATALMLSLMEAHDADVVHGGWVKTETESEKLIGRRVPENSPYIVSDNPMEFVFEQRIHRMSQMVRRDTFMQAGGCDERVFIQDESLGLRLSRVARRFIVLKAPILLIPKVEGELSRNVSQLNHDRFLAHRDMIVDFPDLDETARRRLYRRCVSAMWKQKRLMRGHLRATLSPDFLHYMQSRVRLQPVNDNELAQMTDFFASLKGVRRVAGSAA